MVWIVFFHQSLTYPYTSEKMFQCAGTRIAIGRPRLADYPRDTEKTNGELFPRKLKFLLYRGTIVV